MYMCIIVVREGKSPYQVATNVHCFSSLPQVTSPGIWRALQISNFDQYKDIMYSSSE